MHFPITTGQVARLLGAAEPRLNDLVRRQKIQPQPAVIVGRRQWLPDHVRQAADALGVLTPDLESRLDADAELAPRA